MNSTASTHNDPTLRVRQEPPPQELVHFWSPDRRPGIYFQFICERITSFQIIRHQQAGGSSSDQAERDAPRHVLPSHRTLWRSTGAAGLLAWFINFSPSVRGISPRLWCLRIQSTTTTTSVTSEPQNRSSLVWVCVCLCACVYLHCGINEKQHDQHLENKHPSHQQTWRFLQYPGRIYWSTDL